MNIANSIRCTAILNLLCVCTYKFDGCHITGRTITLLFMPFHHHHHRSSKLPFLCAFASLLLTFISQKTGEKKQNPGKSPWKTYWIRKWKIFVLDACVCDVKFSIFHIYFFWLLFTSIKGWLMAKCFRTLFSLVHYLFKIDFFLFHSHGFLSMCYMMKWWQKVNETMGQLSLYVLFFVRRWAAELKKESIKRRENKRSDWFIKASPLTWIQKKLTDKKTASRRKKSMKIFRICDIQNLYRFLLLFMHIAM